MAKPKEIMLLLDPDDAKAVRQALRYRKTFAMPSGSSNEAGALVGEICRGWLDMLGKWKWPGNPDGKPTLEAKPVVVLRPAKGKKKGALPLLGGGLVGREPKGESL